MIKNICKNIYISLRGALLRLICVRIAKPNSGAMAIQSILAIRIDRIGDLVATLPGFRALRDIFPQAKITVLTSGANAQLLKLMPWIDEIITYQGFFTTIMLLRKKKFDLSIDFLMDYPIKSALLAFFSNAKFTVGFDVAGRGTCFSLSMKPAQEKKHVSFYILDLVRLIAKTCTGRDWQVQGQSARLSIAEDKKSFARSLLKENNISEKDFVIIMHPGGHYASQRWPVERFAELADQLIKKYNAKVIIVGDAKEEGMINLLRGAMKEKPLIITRLALDHFAGLMSLADLFIGNNSGPLHIAGALGVSTISTLGPTDSSLWWPQGENQIVVKKEFSCSPCDKAQCVGHECMKAISVQDMLEAAQIQIEKQRESR